MTRRLENQEKPMLQFESKVWKRLVLQFKAARRNKKNPLLFSLFVLFRSSADWVRPTLTGEGHLFYSVYILRSLSHLETPTQTPHKSV